MTNLEFINAYEEYWAGSLRGFRISDNFNIAIPIHIENFLQSPGVPNTIETPTFVFRLEELCSSSLVVSDVVYFSILEDEFTKVCIRQTDGQIFVAYYVADLESYEIQYCCRDVVSFFLVATQYHEFAAKHFTLDPDFFEYVASCPKNVMNAASKLAIDSIKLIDPTAVTTEFWLNKFPLL